MKSLRLYISPYFLSRHYRSKDINAIAAKYTFTGSLIDIGCGTKPHKKSFPGVDYRGIDFKTYSKNKDFKAEQPDYLFDDNYSKSFKLPFKNGQFDNLVSFQVVEHHKYPEKFINEAARVVKKDGYLLITAPFLGGLHEEPNDFQRITKYKMISMLEDNGCDVIYFKEEGSLFSTIAMLLNEQNNNFAAKNIYKYAIATLLHAPLLVFSYLTLLLDPLFKSKTIYFNYLVLAKKK